MGLSVLLLSLVRSRAHGFVIVLYRQWGSRFCYCTWYAVELSVMLLYYVDSGALGFVTVLCRQWSSRFGYCISPAVELSVTPTANILLL